MKRTVLLATALLALVSACNQLAPTSPVKRVTLERTGGTTFRLVTAPGQLPYCLAYTVSGAGLTRQLTMSRLNQSFECAGGQPIGKHPFRVPLDEGPVKIHVIFTSQPVNAGSVSQQIMEAENRQALHVMSMRLPGNAFIETLEFVPEEDTPAEVGGLVTQDAGTPAEGDAGAP
jgi:hypothetical protein